MFITGKNSDRLDCDGYDRSVNYRCFPCLADRNLVGRIINLVSLVSITTSFFSLVDFICSFSYVKNEMMRVVKDCKGFFKCISFFISVYLAVYFECSNFEIYD